MVGIVDHQPWRPKAALIHDFTGIDEKVPSWYLAEVARRVGYLEK